MTIPRWLFIYIMGMLFGGLLAVCITFAALYPHHHPGWPWGIAFTAMAIVSFGLWIWDTD